MNSDNLPQEGGESAGSSKSFVADAHELRYEWNAKSDTLHRTMVVGFVVLGVEILAKIVLTIALA